MLTALALVSSLALVAWHFSSSYAQPECASYAESNASITQVEAGLRAFSLQNGRLPEGIDELIRSPHTRMHSPPVNACGHSLAIRPTANGARILDPGPDGKFGNDDDREAFWDAPTTELIHGGQP